MRRIFINGKFTAQSMTGVQRYAGELLRAWDDMLATAARPGPPPLLLLPQPGGLPGLRHIEQRVVPAPWQGRGGLHAWEQFVLPRAARSGLLLSLAGSAPARAVAQVATLHDAAVFDRPLAYTRAFRGWYRWLFRRLGRCAAGLLTVSAFSRTCLALALGQAEARFDVVPGGADHLARVQADEGALRRLGLANRPFLLAVGSESVNKNIGLLLRAYAELGDNLPGHGMGLVLAGGAATQIFAAGAGPPDPEGVLRLGPVDDATLKALYGQAQALVMPSLYEGFGLPLLEAMSCGCPVLAARTASLPEVGGDAALFFDPHDTPALALLLQRLVQDDALRQHLRAAGKEQAERWPWARAAVALDTAIAAAQRLA